MNLISDYEYLMYNKDSESFSVHEDEIKLYNKILIEKYPWLGRRVYDDKPDSYIPDPEEDYGSGPHEIRDRRVLSEVGRGDAGAVPLC